MGPRQPITSDENETLSLLNIDYRRKKEERLGKDKKIPLKRERERERGLARCPIEKKVGRKNKRKEGDLGHTHTHGTAHTLSETRA